MLLGFSEGRGGSYEVPLHIVETRNIGPIISLGACEIWVIKKA